ncbi:hypothetical protein EI94DRAFT_1696073 [Lactarius quietus]|nr:hypothetical protein EI94DRAFT_1696073 [Lactarius quietus]
MAVLNSHAVVFQWRTTFHRQSASTSSRVPSCVPVERDPFTPIPSQKQPSSIVTQPSSIRAPLSSPVPVPQPSSTVIKPSCTHAKASSALTQTSTPQIQSSSTLLQPSHQNLSLLNTVHTHEPPEYEYSQTRFHVPSREHTGSEPPSRTVIEVITLDLPSEEPASVEGLDHAKKLREQARRRGREMSEARSRAKSAQKKGNRGAAHVHRQEAISHENAMKELDKRAAKIFFRENNKNRKEGMVDLHGLYVAEAIQFAMDQVQAAKSRDDKDVRFIVGKGLHSDAGGAKIRPALEKKFTKQGLKHSLDPKNAGVLIVRLD